MSDIDEVKHSIVNETCIQCCNRGPDI